MKITVLLPLISLMMVFTACQEDKSNDKSSEKVILQKSTITKTYFGDSPDGPAYLFTLKNVDGTEVQITNYGGIIVSLKTKDKNGSFGDIVLGFDSIGNYVDEHPYFGAIIGRYGNRIAKGKFSLDGENYSLATNNGPNHLHGGIKGFDKVLWQASEIEEESAVGLALNYLSKDMEEGYPGNLSIEVIYLLTEDNSLSISYSASTDKKTICNLTNHSYFNLGGAGNGDILSHELMINADQFTPVDETLIPTGIFQDVDGTPFDFRTATSIGKRIDFEDTQLEYGLGYDHNFVLNRNNEGLEKIASLYEVNSGRFMEILTTEPGLQFYSGNFLDGSNVGKEGKVYHHRYGLCLETQHYPDSPNQASFPSVTLNPGEEYSSKTVYRFSVK